MDVFLEFYILVFHPLDEFGHKEGIPKNLKCLDAWLDVLNLEEALEDKTNVVKKKKINI